MEQSEIQVFPVTLCFGIKSEASPGQVPPMRIGSLWSGNAVSRFVGANPGRSSEARNGDAGSVSVTPGVADGLL